MNKTFTNFLTKYIVSLKERTRDERRKKTGKILKKIGIDWLIYQLGISKGWAPVRLPFMRMDSDEKPVKSKTEAEFGIDVSFLSKAKDELIIFALKDEILNNSNWGNENFKDDLEKATYPDLSLAELSSVSKVNVILAYNKDEDQTGITLFNRFVKGQRSELGDGISLSFERWNLTKIVQEVQEHLLTPDILPPQIAGQFNYICSQFRDFEFNSEEWENLLIPNWKNFLKTIEKENFDIKTVNVVSVLMVILNEYRNDSPASSAAWLDLLEWAMLCVFENKIDYLPNKEIAEMWYLLYIGSLEQYIEDNQDVFTTENGFSANKYGGALGLTSIHESYATYWHIARIGICYISWSELNIGDDAENRESVNQKLSHFADLIILCANNNPATFRPLTDLNHIELFMIWLILFSSGRQSEIYQWLNRLDNYLMVRRVGCNISLPFIESRNRIDLIAKFAATGERPFEYSDSSSYLLLMILEICCSLPEEEKQQLLKRYCKRTIGGIGDNDKKIVDNSIDLISWHPPENWNKKILSEPVTDGIAITIGYSEDMHEHIEEYIETIKEKYPQNFDDLMPLSVYILACLKHKSPLPAKYWRDMMSTMS